MGSEVVAMVSVLLCYIATVFGYNDTVLQTGGKGVSIVQVHPLCRSTAGTCSNPSSQISHLLLEPGEPD